MTPISYDLKAAAAATGLSISHFKRAISTGELKAKRSNDAEDAKWSKLLVKASDLEAYIDALPDG